MMHSSPVRARWLGERCWNYVMSLLADGVSLFVVQPQNEKLLHRLTDRHEWKRTQC